MFRKKYKFSSADFIALKSSGEYIFTLIFIMSLAGIGLFNIWKKSGGAFFADISSIGPAIFITALVLFFFIIMLHETGPRIAVSSLGLWTRQSGFIEWEKIWYQDFIEKDGSSNMYGPYFYFKVLDSDKDYKVLLKDLNKTIDEIRETVSKYSKK